MKIHNGTSKPYTPAENAIQNPPLSPRRDRYDSRLVTPLSLPIPPPSSPAPSNPKAMSISLAIAAILDQLDGVDCNARCIMESNRALEILMVQKKFP